MYSLLCYCIFLLFIILILIMFSNINCESFTNKFQKSYKESVKLKFFPMRSGEKEKSLISKVNSYLK